MLPFTHEQFVAVFVQYNTAVWPLQIVAWLGGLCMVGLLVRELRGASRWVGTALGLMWVWTGVVYHGRFFAAINPVAPVFGALFVAQGVMLLHAALWRGWPQTVRRHGLSAWAGWSLMGYALLLYPLIGVWSGQRYPALPAFGITPCPLTLFTLGLLCVAGAPVPRRLLVVPLLWSGVGGSAAWLLGVSQDWPLLLGLTVVPLLLWRDTRPGKDSPSWRPA